MKSLICLALLIAPFLASSAPRPTEGLIPHRAFVKLPAALQTEYVGGVQKVIQTIWEQKLVPAGPGPTKKSSWLEKFGPAVAFAQMGGKRLTCEEIDPTFRALYPQYCLPASDTKEPCPPKARMCNPLHGFLTTDGRFLCIEYSSADHAGSDTLKQKCAAASEANKNKLAEATTKYFRDHPADYDELSKAIGAVCEKSDTSKCNGLRDDLRSLNAVLERGSSAGEGVRSEGTR